MAVAGMASCADKVANAPEEISGNAIRLSAVSDFTRAGDITTNNLKSFNVYAYTGTDESPEIFMNNVVVTKNSNNSWTYSPLAYWPSKETVDFYAFSPSSWVGESGSLAPVAYDNAGAGQDIVYAVAPDMSGNTGVPNPQVVLNFRHAL